MLVGYSFDSRRVGRYSIPLTPSTLSEDAFTFPSTNSFLPPPSDLPPPSLSYSTSVSSRPRPPYSTYHVLSRNNPRLRLRHSLPSFGCYPSLVIFSYKDK